MKKIVFIWLMVSLLFQGCAPVTYFHGIAASMPQGAHYQKLIVHSDLADANDRKTVEDAVVQQLTAIGVNATASYSFFAVDNTYTWPEKKQMIRADGFDAGLLVQVVDSYAKTQTQFFINHTAADFTTAHVKMQTKMMDMRTFTVVWQGKSTSLAQTDDEGGVSLQDVMTSYATALVTELQTEGVVVGKTN
jgi:hypothetical protein